MFCQTAALQGHTDQVEQQKAKERNCRNSDILKQLWQTLIHQFEFCIVIAAAKRFFCSLKRSDRFWQVFSFLFSPHLKNSKRAEYFLSFSPVLAFHSRHLDWHLHATGFPTVQPIRKGNPRRACWWGGRGHYPVTRESRQSFCHCKCKSVNTLRSSHSGMPQADSFSPSQSQSVCVADDFYVHIFPSSFIPFFAR